MDNYINYVKNKINKPEIQAALSSVSAGISIGNPAMGAVIQAFKEISSVADSIKGEYIIRGLSTELNVETFTNELLTYVSQSEENAFYIATTLRKAILADSKIVCSLMGRIIADHIKDKKTYDRHDVIIVRALESATDDDIITFRKMMKSIRGNAITLKSDEYTDCIDWGVSNRLFKHDQGEEVKGSTIVINDEIIPSGAAYKLSEYIDKIKQIFRYID